MKKTIVLGLGVSGKAAAEFLLRKGEEVLAIDKQVGHSDVFEALRAHGALVQAEEEEIAWDEVGQLIVSPGVSPKHPIYAEARMLKIPVKGEAQLGLEALQIPMVAVTGTNGKTTVTLLVEHILRLCGVRAKALGNVGEPLCRYALGAQEDEALVVELSSYQLETLSSPLFETAALLNVTPDHLERYEGMEAYARAKCHLGSLVKKGGAFFVQEQVAQEYGSLLHGASVFGRKKSLDLWTDGEAIFEGERVVCIVPMSYRQQGAHEEENLLAAWALCRPFKVGAEAFASALESFKKPAHRIEWVRTLKGIDFYDDSKGTNLDAVIQAVGTMKGAVVLIAGGVDKGASYLLWREPFARKVKHIVVFGQAAAKIEGELSPYFPVTRVASLEEAVKSASGVALSGECVLLSPGCSSFDQFRDYAHRGEEFQHYVRNMS